jgi:hypothetical protein
MSRRYRPWTEDDTATLRRMARAGYAIRAIAEHMDRGHAQIVHKMQDHGIEPGLNPLHIAALARANMRRRMAAA